MLNTIFVVLGIAYALKIYPSYFDDSAPLKSNASIAFMNLFFGGIIFGCVWNSNLANRHRGISHIVFSAINVIAGLAAIVLVVRAQQIAAGAL